MLLKSAKPLFVVDLVANNSIVEYRIIQHKLPKQLLVFQSHPCIKILRHNILIGNPRHAGFPDIHRDIIRSIEVLIRPDNAINH